MKKILTLALAVCMMLTALTLTASAEDFKLTMRLSHVFSPGEALCDYIDEACNSIREKTNGAIDIQTFPSGQIDVYKDAVMQVVNGANFISVEDPSYIGDYVPDFNVLAGPMMTSSIEEYEYLIHGDTVQEMIKKLEDYNIKVLALDYFFGYRFMKTNKEIYTP
ncbi:MAG: C4-dicarboxylate ABC transporter substrate-binding protein, partial [Clostridiales bacterium]|nr:C4-dicarboxylate ABC transporter substrate-binding protein [Clostridiales bacterium]